MNRIVIWLVFVVWLSPAAAGADKQPAKGTLLVATELVHGDVFAQTVILLLHYDENGAMGIVVNRSTDIEPGELIADVDAISGYSGTLYWGGPVQMNSLRALLRTDTPPKGAEAIVDWMRATGQPVKSRAVLPIRTTDYPTPAKRPAYSALDCSILQDVFGISLPDWREQLSLCVED